MTLTKISFVLLGSILSATAFSSPAFAEDQKRALIHVTGEGRVSIAPDIAIVSLGVTKEGKTAREALDANKKAMTDVLTAMTAAGIEDKDLQTSNFSIQPQYVYPRKNDGTEKPRITGYIVRNSLTVRIRDLENVGNVLDATVSLGVNDGGNLVFSNDNPKPAIEQARIKAMKDAIAKATTLTTAAGIELGSIVEISEQSRQGRPVPIARARTLEVASYSEPVPIAAGENTYNVSVNVSFALPE